MRKIQFQSFVWLDIDFDPDQIKAVDQMIDLDVSTEKLLQSTMKLQRLEKFPEYMAVVLHYPLYNKELRKNIAIEIDCVLAPGFFITAHKEDLHFLNEIFHNQEHQPTLNNPVELYMKILETMLNACLTPLNRVAEHIDRAGEEIFKGKERSMIGEISLIKRDVLDFRKTIRLHKAVIDPSFRLIPQYFPHITLDTKMVADILSTNIHIWNITENLKEAIEAFDETNQTLLSHKLNENLKTLTIFSTTLAPATLVVGLLGINARMDFLESSSAFFIVLGIVFTLIVTLLIYFQKQNILD